MLLLGLVACLPASAQEAEPKLRLPGSTWGEVRTPASVQPEDAGNLIVEGAVEQGLEIGRLGASTALTLFAKLDYTLDTTKFDFNNKLKGGVGAKVQHALSQRALIEIGAKLEDDYRYRSGRHLRGHLVFVDWSASWAPAGGGRSAAPRPLGYPGYTWGGVRYPGSQDPAEEHDVILEGALEQGIDWARLGSRGILNTFAQLEYIADTQSLDYNNEVALAVGAKIKLPVASGRGLVQIGAKYLHAYRWESRRSEADVLLFVNWSGSWQPRAARQAPPVRAGASRSR